MCSLNERFAPEPESPPIGIHPSAVVDPTASIDPTGAGRLLGLTDIGETKMQLASEAGADRAATAGSIAAAAPAAAPASALDLSGLYQRIDALEGAVRDLNRSLEASRLAAYMEPLLALPDRSLRRRLAAWALDHGVVLPPGTGTTL